MDQDIFQLSTFSVQASSGCVINYQNEADKAAVKVFVPKRSLLQLSNEAYTDYLHSIEFSTKNEMVENYKEWLFVEDDKKKIINYRTQRYSLTFRHVLPQ